MSIETGVRGKMGEIVGVRIHDFEYISYKNTFGDLLSIFSKEDLRIETAIDDEGQLYQRYYFVTTVSRAKKCLDCLGHTLEAVRRDFEADKNEKLEFIEYCQEDQFSTTWSYKDIEEGFSFEEWSNAVKKYARILSESSYDYAVHRYKEIEAEREKEMTLTEKIVLDSLPWNRENYFGLEYENIDKWNVFRIILETFSPDEKVILEYTDLYNGGWCDEVPSDEEYAVPKTIILTEGKFDVEVLSKSMQVLYPYMSKYYSFMNFSDLKVHGGSHFLTHYVKAFIAAGIQNRVIALYDNDSAGRAEIVSLSKIKCPDNFRIMHLPEIQLAEKYPVIGEQNLVNINGIACSIELFLGKDILLKDGQFIPIQIKGCIGKEGANQGEILHKSLIQNRFRDKIKKTLVNGNIEEENWGEMRILLENIFSVFIEKQ